MSGRRSTGAALALKPNWPRPREREATRLAILEAARRLTEQLGAEAVTLSAVAVEAGIARATIYGYFSSKRQLLAELNGEVFEPEPARPRELFVEHDDAVRAGAAETHYSAPAQTIGAASRPASPVDEGDREEASTPHDRTHDAGELSFAVIEESCQEEFSATPQHAPDTEEPSHSQVEATGIEELSAAPHQARDAEEASRARIDEANDDADTDEFLTASVSTGDAGQPSPAGLEVTGAKWPSTEPDRARVIQESSPASIRHIAPEKPAHKPVLSRHAEPEPGALENCGTDELLRLQAAELDTLFKRIVVPEAAMMEGTDTAISRLEARMVIVERALGALETRADTELKTLNEQVSVAVSSMQHVQKRTETAENRLQLALAELRLDVHNLAQNMTAAAPEPIRPRRRRKDDFTPEQAADAGKEPADSAPRPAEPAYLTTARRAAADANEQEAAEPKSGVRSNRWLWLAVLLAVAVGSLGALLYAKPQAPVPSQPAAASAVAVPKPAPVDPITALARAGNPQAQLIIGEKLLSGTGGTANVDKAAHWLLRAAEGGQAIAQASLGVLYQTGTGVAQDYSKAMRWYEDAANHGNVKAMANLGKLYAGGWPEGTDFAKAVHWFGAAAKFGDVDSQFNLAVLLERGEGTPRRLTEAYKWYELAAEQGDKEARARTVLIASALSAEDLKAAKQAAEQFTPDTVNSAANDMPSPAVVAAKPR